MVIASSMERATRAACLKQFLESCATSAKADQADRLREAACLLGLDPRGMEGRKFEAMVTCGAYESASLMLLGDATPFILSRGGSGTCLASTTLADKSEDVVVEGATLTLALLGAHVTALLAEYDGPPAAGSTSEASPRAGALFH